MVEIINNLNKSNPTPSLSLAPELTDELSLLEASLGGGGNHSGPQPLAQKLFNVFKNFGNLFSSLVTLLNNYYSLITLYFTCTGWAKKVIYCVWLFISLKRLNWFAWFLVHVNTVLFWTHLLTWNIHSFIHFFKINNDKTHCCDNRGTPRKMQSK